ncbi:MAG: MSHA biogenesis protein MshG [Gallionellales bacterium RIFCSPLOWO2_12_FULL_57_18]|nr:MAG: MSHA biogenesis protein MshG [Gallionellales bacterium RIFCSPLOWO2_12_FULL_57_18]OGS97029.1 MAG: MSHA biogenesis protein MshG [Gallionellales bacterium RIFCSPLOWO2_02_FULL_57_47]OGT12567.1 MAG: MSHA biogenesis protein MshG [Gallionellales bacterium RIFCSPHIGHO2_02_FULL_57_16]
MGVFAYKGRNGLGELVQGTLDGDDSGAIADQLLNTGITPVEVSQVRGVLGATSGKPGWIKRQLTDKPITPIDLLLFSRQMYTLLKAGVPIMRALAGLQESTQNPAFSALLQDLRESLDNGRELSTAMRRHPKVFSPFYASMVQVGEMTGMLDVTFIRMYEHLEFERDMRERIKTAMRYPSFVIMAMAIAIVVINLFVIPAFAKVYAGFHTELPAITKMLIGFSGFMVSYWMLLLAMLAGAVLGFRLYTNTREGRYKWDRYKFKLPIAGEIILKATLARFARSMALSFKSGMPILQGMNVVGMVVDNEFMRSRIEQMRDGVERGESILRTATAAGVFNPVVLQMIAVGEESGDMDGLMFEIADMYEREVKYEVATLSSKIEPILIVALGILVLILALGVFLPMWDLGKAAMH